MSDRRLEELDSLRGVAAVAVLFHHTLMVLPHFSDFSVGRSRAHGLAELLLFQTPLSLLWAGHAAVLLFFILSGFVLAMPFLNGKAPPYPAFAVRRIFRIYAPYIIVVLAVMGLLITVRLPPVHGLSSWLHKSWNRPVTWDVLVQHLLMTGQDDFIDNPVWSLDWEMRISAVFPLLMAPLLFWRRWGGPALGAALLAVFFGFEALFKRPGQGDPVFLLYTLAFVAGATAAAHQDRLRFWLGRGGLASVLALAGALAMSRIGWFAREGVAGELILLLGALAVICAAIAPGPLHRALLHPALKGLGRISYSLYLVHVPVILLLTHLLQGRAPLVGILVASLLISLLTADLVNRWVEQPCDRLGRWLAQRLPRGASGSPALPGSVAPDTAWPRADGRRDAA